MNFHRFLIAGGFVAAATVGASSARATPSPTQVVTWHTDRALIEGTGCEKNVDAWTIASGHDMSMIFTNLQVNLSHNGPAPDTAGRSQCSVRVPVDVMRGIYLRHYWQTLSLRVTKSDYASVNAGANSTFFNIATSSPQIRVSSGWGTSLDRAFLVATTDDSPPAEAFCKYAGPSSAPIPGIFRANVGLSAQRESAFDDAIIGAGPTDVRLDVETSWAYCP